MKKKYAKPELCDLFAVARGSACGPGDAATVCGNGSNPTLEPCAVGTDATMGCVSGNWPGSS